jgi:hypothetical protein
MRRVHAVVVLAVLSACSPGEDPPSRTLSRVEVTPPSPTVPVGAGVSFHATAVWSDEATEDVTEQATWSSSADAVLSVSSSAGTKGEAQALSAGTATVTATFEGVAGQANATVQARTLAAIQVTPTPAGVAKGQDLQLTATAVYDDASTWDVTSTATWASEAPAVASVSDAHGTKGRVRGESVGQAVVTATFGGETGSATVDVGPAVLVSVRVEPLDAEIPVGAAQPLEAWAVLSDGSELDVTASAEWSAAPGGVVSLVAGPGPNQATGLAPGTASVTASYQGVSGSATVRVRAATLLSLEVTPAAPATVVGGTVQLTATGTYDSGQVVDVTSLATWSSTDGLVASVSNAAGEEGKVTGVAVGSATITASLGGVSDAVAVQVAALSVAAVRVDPDAFTVSPGRSVTVRAFGKDASGAEVELTGAVTWATSASGVATVSGGVVTGVSAGTAEVYATYDWRTAQADVKVEPAYPVSLAVRTGGKESAGVGMSGWLQAKAVYSDGSERDVTELARWTSDAPGVVSVSDVPGEKGLVACLAAGTTQVAASFAGLSTTVTFTVTPRAVRWIALSAAPAPLPVGVTHPFSARATYDDWTSEDVTLLADWSAHGPISVDAGGVVSTIAPGGGAVTASYGGVSGSTLVSVTGTAPTSLALSLNRPTIVQGDTTWWSAALVFPSGATWDVTEGTSLRSANEAVADVYETWSGPEPRGVSPGTATIEAHFGGLVGTATLTVQAAGTPSMQLPAQLPVGAAVRASFSVSGADLADEAMWTSSDTSVVTVTSSGGPYAKGWVTATGTGTATITATWGSLTASRSVTVRARALTIDVTPPFAEILAYDFLGSANRQQFTATARLADGTTLDVTKMADWFAGDSRVVGQVYSSAGQFEGGTPGTTTITASLPGAAGHAVITVLPEAATSLSFWPAAGPYRLPPGVTFSFQLTASSPRTLMSPSPADVAWTSSNTAVAAFSTEPGREWELTTVGKGTATITASYRGAVATTTVIVDDIVGLVATPPTLSLKAAQLTQIQVRAVYPCAPLPCTPPAFDVAPYMGEWTSSDPTLVTASGPMVLGYRIGDATIEGTFAGMPVSVPVTVAAPAVKSVAVEEQPPYGYLVGTSTPVSAKATLDNGQWVDVTDLATWSVAPHTVEIGTVEGTPPALNATAAGTGNLRATYGGVTGSTYVEVKGTPPAAIAFATSVFSLPVGGSTSTYIRSPSAPSYWDDHVGTEATVTSSDPAVVEVENRKERVFIRAKAVGSAVLTASYRGIEAHAVVSVHAAAGPMDVAVGYGAWSTMLHVHERMTLSAVAGGASGDPEWYGASVTGGATWTSSDPGVVRVVSPGVVEGVGAGTAIITATHGAWSASEQVTVLDATVEGVLLSPFAVAIPAGTTYELSASARYSDGGSAKLPHLMTWWAEDTAIADFDPAAPGVVRAKAPGLTYVEARFDGKSARIPVTVF